MSDDSILTEADRLVSADRQMDYGHPFEDFGRTAQMWSAILGVEVTRTQVAQCMVAVKLSRLSATPNHRDSWVDVAGYAKCGDIVSDIEAQPDHELSKPDHELSKPDGHESGAAMACIQCGFEPHFKCLDLGCPHAEEPFRGGAA